ncbi:MAG: carbon monoxide dehydrogenase accessory protein CooC [Deltaproteobacteria bacterium]|jgi:CO dehydrogenase maturation factor|nr:carbon monoxide dehydrogenase accessory protein CooC [Deltaproteobacteria bacterium]
MKLAVTGKGGVGKTTVVAGLARVFADRGQKVLAIDADPASNLALALGFSKDQRLTPISAMKELIEERTESKTGSMGGFFKLNPRVDDLPDKYTLIKDGIRLMVMGTVQKGGGGCVCPENVMVRTLVAHLLLGRDEVVILDMEAGVEHLGRATAQAVDKLIVVVEPGQRSLEVAQKIRQLAADIGLKNIGLVGNKIRKQADREFLLERMPEIPFLGFLSYDSKIVEADLSGEPPYKDNPEFLRVMAEIVERIGS